MPMFVEIQFLKLITKLGIMLNIPKLLKKLPKLIMKLDTYAVGVVEIQTVGVGDVKDDKVWYAVREAQLAVHEALENIVFCEIHATRALDKVSEALDAIEEVTEAVLSGCRYSVAVADKIEIIRVVIGQHHFWSWS